MGRSAATAAKPRPVRLLIPIWGADYIAAFCRTALPSLLSPNNLPFLARAHSTEVLFLTRSGERGLFDAYPAYRRLAELVPVVFTAIDDLLERFFDPFPDAYATALTHAFFRGIETVGAGACDTDFLFWNADFLAADGLFRTLAELIAAGVRCTFAPSFRVDRAIEEAVLAGRRSADGAVLDIGPREWVRLAARFRHPTVMAQTVNRFEERMIDSVNQLYWQVSDTLIVARVFLMFLLHLRPERVWERVYGHCDYVFAPEMAPAVAFHFETRSDRVLIVELQHHNREAAEIVFADAAMTPGEVAHGVARWTTREHRLASQQLVVFNGGDNEADLGAARQTTDDFMDAVYARLPAEPIWHNGHFYWRESLAALGLGYEGPGPDHPRSHLAAALRVTGYDIDLLRESWPASGGAPRELFGLALPLDPQFDFAAWLLAVQARYLAAWCDGAASPAADSDELDLISGHFHGFGWGLAEHGSDGWLRHLGPDGRATLLLRAPASRKVQVWLRGAGTSLESLAVSLNGGDPERLIPGSTAGNSLAQFKIGRDRVAAADGRLQIRFCAPPAALAASEPGCAGLAFSGITIRIG